jgi:hypothetical protein
MLSLAESYVMRVEIPIKAYNVFNISIFRLIIGTVYYTSNS